MPVCLEHAKDSPIRHPWFIVSCDYVIISGIWNIVEYREYREYRDTSHIILIDIGEFLE